MIIQIFFNTKKKSTTVTKFKIFIASNSITEKAYRHCALIAQSHKDWNLKYAKQWYTVMSTV